MVPSLPEEEIPAKAAVSIKAATTPATAEPPSPDLLKRRPTFQRLRGGLGAFGSGNVCHFTPSTVLSRAFAATGSLPASPSQVAHTSYYSASMAGMRGSSSSSLIMRRISSFAGTVTITHTQMGTGEFGTSACV